MKLDRKQIEADFRTLSDRCVTQWDLPGLRMKWQIC